MGTGSTRGACRHRSGGALNARAWPVALALLLASLTLRLAAAAIEPPHESLEGFPQADLAVAASGKTHAFRVWVAATEPHRVQGLMWVRELKSHHGMLFVFDAPQVASFWMKNTFIPLDMLFIGPDNRVIRIAANTTPLSLAPVDSLGVVRAVLELRGGTVERLGIAPGARVTSAALDKPH